MIKVLDKKIADKIAAGEVIERPVSIIKELVENSIDAGSTSILVEIKKGGKSYIRVTDNGCGIPKDEAEKAFLRHATSKINTVEDLEAIETLGFRGEALASICAVTRTELLTKQNEEKTGTRLIIHGGEIISNTVTGCPDGTTFVVTDLFYNTPARQKFMKSDASESSMIIDLISQMALYYKDISFRLINNGNILFSTSGDGDRLKIISKVYPNISIKDLVPVDYHTQKMSVTGYISAPSVTRPTKTGQIFFVNGRVINSKVIEKGIKEGYSERLFDGRHPIAYLFIDINAADLDVNIHPNKKEIRFNDDNLVVASLSAAIKESLASKEAVPKAINIFREAPLTNIERSEQINTKNITSTNSASSLSVLDGPEIPKICENKSCLLKEEKNVYLEECSKSIEEKNSDYNFNNLNLSIDKPLITPFDFDEISITGSVFNTYITAVDGENLYLIDQHAAHERIFYEKLVNEYINEEKLKQPILFPIIIDVDFSSKENDETWLNLLGNMGFTIELFGPSSYRISEIPTFMDIKEAEDFVNDFIQGYIANNTNNTIIINKLIMKACKSAIKANDKISLDEIHALIKDLKNCVNPFSCPHGRPTFIKLSKHEIEKLFKRV